MRRGERGAAALLLLMSLMALLAAAGLQVHRSVVRELAMEGDALQGDRAALAADSTLAWFLEDGWREVHLADETPAVLVRAPGEVFGEEAESTEGEVKVLRLGILEPEPGIADGSAREVWKLTIRGRRRPPGGAGEGGHAQVREAYLVRPAAAGDTPLALWAWRTVP